MVDTPWMPRAVRDWVTEIERNTGDTPQVERIDPRRYRITLENDRVRMTLDVKLTSGQGWIWAGSTLTVDGERQPLAPSPEAFYRLYREPESGGRRRAKLPPLEPYPLEDPPAEARAFIAAARTRFEQDRRLAGATLQIGQIDGNLVLQVDLDDSAAIQLSVLPEGISMRAVRDGYEVTHDLDRELHDAIAALFTERGVPKRPEAPSPGARSHHAPARLTSVEVRKQSVMRI